METQSPSDPPRSRATGRSVTRSRTGCLTCRRRKVRCDRTSAPADKQGSCENCIRLKLDCRLPAPGSRRRAPRKSGSREQDNASSSADTCLLATQNGHSTAAMANSGTSLSSVNQTAASISPHSLPQANSASSVMPQPHPDSTSTYLSSTQEPYATDQMSFGRDMNDMSAFSSYGGWPSAYPFSQGLVTPFNGMLQSSMLPWKDMPQSIDQLMASADNNILDDPSQDLSQGLRLWSSMQGTSRVASRRQSVSPPPAPSPPRQERARIPKRIDTVSGVDFAAFDVSEHQRQLLRNFTPKANPIPLFTPADLQWKSAYSSLVNLSYGCPHLIDAICAISELNLVSSTKGSISRALKYYGTAGEKAEAVLNVPSTHVDDKGLRQAFATLFLLMHAEIMAQPLAGLQHWPIHHLRTAYRHLKRHHQRLRSWSGIGSNILSWILIVDSKAVYAAGMEGEPDRSPKDTQLEALSSAGDGSADIASFHAGSPGLSNQGSVPHDYSFMSPESLANGPDQSPDFRLDEPVSAAEIAYDALYQPAYRFFMRCQCFIPRIIALDAHHRKRGPLDSELEVLQLGQRLRADLRDMWLKRPPSLGVLEDTDGLHEVLHPRVARKIIQSFRSFVANFHAIRILLHRVAFIHYPVSDDVQNAIDEILRLAKEQSADGRRDSIQRQTESTDSRKPVGNTLNETAYLNGSCAAVEMPDATHQPSSVSGANEENANDETTNGPGRIDTQFQSSKSDGDVFQAMLWLWPLFMCGTECGIDERRWVLDRMYALGSVNADRTALLLTEVTKQQDETKKRVDQRSIRQKIFADEFDVVY